VTDSVTYATLAVLVCLLLWRVATQWKVRSAKAELRASLIILGVVALAFVVWQYVQQASPIALILKTRPSPYLPPRL
jgi:Flp pilus assembly protein TadB